MINKFHKKTLSLFIKESMEPQINRAKYGSFVGWNSIIVNTILFILKILLGLMINSMALIADSIHSISDTATSFIVIIGFRVSGKPADKKHPFGHQRAEYIATLVIAIILVVAGIEFIKEGIERFKNPESMKYSFSILALIILTMFVKFWMGSLTQYIGEKINSQSIRADAVHHYTDVISTVFVLISVFFSKFGYYAFDGMGSALVGIMLIYTGFTISIDASDMILGTAPSKRFIKKLKKLANNISGVVDAHDIIIHNYGEKQFITLHIEIDGKINCLQSHDIAIQVEESLQLETNAHITVHIDPIELSNPILKKVYESLSEMMDKHKWFHGFHDLRFNKHHDVIIFDIIIKNNNHNNAEKIIKNQLVKQFQEYKFEIHIDPIFMNN